MVEIVHQHTPVSRSKGGKRSHTAAGEGKTEGRVKLKATNGVAVFHVIGKRLVGREEGEREGEGGDEGAGGERDIAAAVQVPKMEHRGVGVDDAGARG